MKLTCLLRRHAASNPYFATRNGDIWFGECPICLIEIIKVGHARWREVPRGYRIVWRSRPMSEMAAPPPRAACGTRWHSGGAIAPVGIATTPGSERPRPRWGVAPRRASG